MWKLYEILKILKVQKSIVFTEIRYSFSKRNWSNYELFTTIFHQFNNVLDESVFSKIKQRNEKVC